MTHYIDIKLNPNKEIRENVLLNQIYSSFHKRLDDLQANDIGVSFPDYKLKLGKVFRIHGSLHSLEKLNEKEWLGKYENFCNISGIEHIPSIVRHRIISRIQQNMTEAKLRRLIKRGNITEEDIKRYRIKMLQNGLDNPYVELVSMSNGKFHRRFIAFSDIQDKEIRGTFDLFGLSKSATIPWF